MEFNRRIYDKMFFLLVILGNIMSLTLSGVNSQTDFSLDCTNDFDKTMICQFDEQNCSGYNVTVESNEGYGTKYCIPEQCDSGRCCCSVKMILVLEETHTATVWEGTRYVENKTINITTTVKPKTPTITSVDESNGNFLVKWKSNVEGVLNDDLTANVTYYKKGHTEKVIKKVKPTTIDDLKVHEIPGRDLEPSTTYVVSVKSYTDWSDKFSDSSNEEEFTTAISPDNLLWIIIISLSIAAVIISAAIFGCYVKLKKEWMEVQCPNVQNPKPLMIHPCQQEYLKPERTICSTPSVEPLIPDDSKPWLKGSQTDISSESYHQSSGISTGSSCLSYAETEPVDVIGGVQDALSKVLPNIGQMSPLTTNPLTESTKDSGLSSTSYNPCDVRADGIRSGSSGFDSKTYSILMPSPPHQIMTDNSEVQTQTVMVCESSYHASDGDKVTCPDQQVPAGLLLNSPPAVSSLMPTDMSYQQRNTESGQLSSTEDSNLPFISSGCDPAPIVETEYESFSVVSNDAAKLEDVKIEEAMVCDDNPCYQSTPAASHSFPQMNDYQEFQNLARQHEVLFSEQRSGEKEEHLDKCSEEPFTKIPPVPPGFSNNVQGDQSLSGPQRPLVFLIPTDQPTSVITDSGYKSV